MEEFFKLHVFYKHQNTDKPKLSHYDVVIPDGLSQQAADS